MYMKIWINVILWPIILQTPNQFPNQNSLQSPCSYCLLSAEMIQILQC